MRCARDAKSVGNWRCRLSGSLKLTCGVGKLVLLALYPILQCLRIPTGDLDLLLDGLCVCVRHCEVCAVQTASMAVAAPGMKCFGLAWVVGQGQSAAGLASDSANGSCSSEGW